MRSARILSGYTASHELQTGFIRGHSGNVDGGVALAIVNGKNGSSANRAGKAHSFDCSSSSRLFNDRAWPWLQIGDSHFHSGLQRADIQLATSVAISFNSWTDGSANLNGGEIPTINDGSWSLIGSPDTIFKRRAVRLPKTRLIRSNGA
jgi:hypothetical protein